MGEIHGDEVFQCPNGHQVAGDLIVECDECEATVHYVPYAVELELQRECVSLVEQLAVERAEIERARTLRLRTAYNTRLAFARERDEARERLAAMLDEIGAYGGPLYLLSPSQGERPDPVTAGAKLREIMDRYR